jgi:sulfatase maturation enzyme AslB (radical SAM superfamily)
MARYKMSDELKTYYETYDYGTRIPIKIPLADLSGLEKFQLMESKYFCILPWIHMHGWPTGEAFLCCMSNEPVGNLQTNTMEEVWNNDNFKQVRHNMINEKPCSQCQRCYNDEKHGLFSMRNSSNKHFGHYIKDVEKTQEDGLHPEFKIRYWDVRFSNICNFKCRYCGPNFSSNWWEDKAALYGADKIGHNKFLHAGKNKDDIWEQMQPHLPYIEQIYFAGGEPLIMEEHYRLLKWLVENNKTHVRLIYNTNFSELTFKKQNVLEWWKKFDSVSVGASLDAMGARAEYMRKGTVWQDIENNRKQMLEICPNVDFYISATVNVFNILHVTDFHRDWVDKEFIKAQDFNINLLHSPEYYRCDILPQIYKEKATAKINDMIDWLKDKDHLTRATGGYKGLLNFLNAKDNTKHLKHFFAITDQLDSLRKEKFETIFLEFGDLREHT